MNKRTNTHCQRCRTISKTVKAYRENELPRIRAAFRARLDRIVAAAAKKTGAARAASNHIHRRS